MIISPNNISRSKSKYFFLFGERRFQLHWFHVSTALADLGLLRVEVARSHPKTNTHTHTHIQ